jgi:tetratricopeptide (TPR) repeat protein
MRHASVILLLLAVAVPYGPGLFHGFVYDDHLSIAENPFLADFGNLFRAAGLRTLRDPTLSDSGRPLVILTYFGDRLLWGLEPFGFHLTNLALHLANAFLLLLLLGRLLAGTGAPRSPGAFVPFAAALLFGLHPALMEAVQIPAFREDPLGLLFTLLFLLLSLVRGAAGWFALPVLALGLLAKESAAAAPLLLALVWICFPAARPGGVSGELRLLAALVVAGAFALMWASVGTLQALDTDWNGLSLRYPFNVLTAPWLFARALRVLGALDPLTADHLAGPVLGAADPRFVAGVGAVGLVLALIAALRRRAPAAALGCGWLLIGFLPVSNLVPLHNPFAERYLYVPAAGFSMLVAAGLSALRGPRLRAFMLAALCAVYAAVSAARLGDFASDAALWSRTLEREPGSARAHTWTGLEAKQRGDRAAALYHFLQADRLNPQEVSALINIAVLYGEENRLRETETLLREAVRRRPRYAEAHWNLAVALHHQGKHAEAAAEIARTLELNPLHATARAVAAEADPAGEGP